LEFLESKPLSTEDQSSIERVLRRLKVCKKNLMKSLGIEANERYRHLSSQLEECSAEDLGLFLRNKNLTDR